MEKQIKELTLVLLYMTSWDEDEFGVVMRRSWKGYPFDSLNDLSEEDLLRDSRRSKSVYLTEAGIKEAETLMRKYNLGFSERGIE